MRIQYLVQHFSQPQEGSGGRAYETAKGLVQLGHQVDVIASDPRVRRGSWRVVESTGFLVHTYPNAYSNEMSTRQRVLSFFRFATAASAYARRLPTDVVLASSTPLTIALPGVFSKALRVPMVFEVRDLWPDMPIAFEALKGRVPIWSARQLELWAYRNSDQIIALSEGMAAGVATRGVPADRITVIPNASDISQFQNSDNGESFLAENPLLRGKSIVLFAGSLGPLYEPSIMVKIAEEFAAISPELALVVIGEGREKQTAIRAARDLQILSRSIFFLDRMPKVQVMSAFAASRVVLSVAADVPGIEHNSANKFFDGLAAGRPVAVNYGGWQAELLVKHRAGLSLCRNPVEAANALADVALDLRRSNEIGQRALRLATSEFDRGTLVKRVETVLARAVADRVGSSIR